MTMTNDNIRPGDVISYMQMCSSMGVNLQRGMNFRLRDGHSVILMSLRRNAPYADRVENDDGSAAKVRTDAHSQYAVTGAEWSPDSKQIAYIYSDYVATQEDQQHWQDIWVTNADGSGSIKFVRGGGRLSWRPSVQ